MKKSQLLAIFVAISSVACSSQEAPRTVATGAACSGLADSEQTLAELYKPGTIYRAEPIKETIFRARAAQPEKTVGASLRVRAQPGMSAPYIQRVLACHAASGASAHANDPLILQTGSVAQLSVEESQFGFKIDVVGDTLKSGEEIWKRADLMTSHGGKVEVQQVAHLSATPSL